jgi:hypothetical protein
MPGAIKNIPKDKIHLNSFIGGQAIDFEYGIANSFYASQALDFRQKASQMSVLPGMQLLSNGLSDLVTAMVQDPSGVRYAVGNQGYVYRINTSGVISPLGQLSSNGAAGIVYNQQSDNVYIPGQQDVSIYGQVTRGTTGPAWKYGNFGVSASTAVGTVDIYDTSTAAYDIPRNNAQAAAASAGGALTPSNYTSYVTNTLTNNYTVTKTTISETPQDFCPFVPDIEPFYSVAVYVTAKGTGNLTLTMHDSLNNNLGSATISNGSLVVGWNNFVFSSPGIRAIPNGFATATSAGYHFHMTSSVAADTTTIATINNNDLTGANMLLFAYRLVKTNNGWHPTTIFGQFLCIGNGPYLSTYTFNNDMNPNNATSGTHGSGWDRHALSFDFGYECCGLSVNNQYLVIAAEKRSTSTNNSYQDGYLYFWDGTNTNFNFKIEIPMGSPYALQTINNITYFICAGSLFAWGGGQQVIKVRYLAYQNTDYLGTVDHTIVNPNMMDVRFNLLMIGFPSSTTNVNLNYGIYSWGAVELTYPNSFGYSYASTLASSGVGQNYSTANNLQLGMIKNFVDTLYMSWQYTDANSVTHYGMDLLNNTSTPAPTFSWQSLIWDGGARYKTKKALRLRINFLPLPSGCTINANYTLNRGTLVSADPTGGAPYTASTGDTALTVEFNNARFNEIQFGFTGTCSPSATTPVTITGVTLEVDPLEDEVGIRSDRSA